MEPKFSAHLNPHYPFDDSAYQAEIKRQEKFLKEKSLLSMVSYLSGGGSSISSPWGENKSIDAGVADANTLEWYLSRYQISFSQMINFDVPADRVTPVEFCIKDLIVNPGQQLSLQRHQGREEFWVVKDGILTVIVDGQRLDVTKGQAIFIPRGSTHCMNNRTATPIQVEELQLGICREEDNIRLLDATRDMQGNPAPRVTYPITTEVEYQSAILYAELAAELALLKGLAVDPQFAKLIA